MMGRTPLVAALLVAALGLLLPALPAAGQEEEIQVHKKGMELYRAAKYREALPFFARAVELAKGRYGAESPLIAAELNDLAEIHRQLGNQETAEVLYKRAIGLDRQAGEDGHGLATSLNNLALLYRTQGRLREAEPLYTRSLVLLEQTLGPNHQDVAKGLNNLAILYRMQGDPESARPLQERALEIAAKVLGPDSPTTRLYRRNLDLVAPADSASIVAVTASSPPPHRFSARLDRKRSRPRTGGPTRSCLRRGAIDAPVGPARDRRACSAHPPAPPRLRDARRAAAAATIAPRPAATRHWRRLRPSSRPRCATRQGAKPEEWRRLRRLYPTHWAASSSCSRARSRSRPGHLVPRRWRQLATRARRRPPAPGCARRGPVLPSSWRRRVSSPRRSGRRRRGLLLARLERQIRRGLARGSEVREVGPFRLYLWPRPEPFYRNRALPASAHRAATGGRPWPRCSPPSPPRAVSRAWSSSPSGGPVFPRRWRRRA
jgi:tetratricopeptide (TPR) repeat protein